MTDREVQRKAFEDKIESDFDNFGLRLIYADQLDEWGEHEEADRQRKYEEAYKFLEKYANARVYKFLEKYANARECYYGADPGDEHYEDHTRYKLNHKQVLAWMDYLMETIEEEGEPFFNDTWPQDQLRERTERVQFFDSLEVVTGKPLPKEVKEKLLKQTFFRCAC